MSGTGWNISQEFDYEQRVKRVVREDGTVVENVYDGMGRRVKETVGGAGKDLVSMEGKVLREYDGAGNLTAQYFWAGFDLLQKDLWGQAGVRYFVPNALRTPFSSWDQVGSQVFRAMYNSFGVRISESGISPTLYEWMGNRRINDTHLLEIRDGFHRYPELGRIVNGFFQLTYPSCWYMLFCYLRYLPEIAQCTVCAMRYGGKGYVIGGEMYCEKVGAINVQCCLGPEWRREWWDCCIHPAVAPDPEVLEAKRAFCGCPESCPNPCLEQEGCCGGIINSNLYATPPFYSEVSEMETDKENWELNFNEAFLPKLGTTTLGPKIKCNMRDALWIQAALIKLCSVLRRSECAGGEEFQHCLRRVCVGSTVKIRCKKCGKEKIKPEERHCYPPEREFKLFLGTTCGDNCIVVCPRKIEEACGSSTDAMAGVIVHEMAHLCIKKSDQGIPSIGGAGPKAEQFASACELSCMPTSCVSSGSKKHFEKCYCEGIHDKCPYNPYCFKCH